MDLGRLFKWLAIIAVIVVAWKVVLPKVKSAGSSSSTTVSDNGCIRSAERASETWGGGLRSFVNPPYDLSAWSSFRGTVESRINAAEADCSCSDPWCTKATSAMRDLRSLIAEMETSIGNGSSAPDDLVQRQERIDNQISEAAESVPAR